MPLSGKKAVEPAATAGDGGLSSAIAAIKRLKATLLEDEDAKILQNMVTKIKKLNEYESGKDTELESFLEKVTLQAEASRDVNALDRMVSHYMQDSYSHTKNEREKATFSMMMKMNPEALTNIRKEFFARRDSVTLHEFIYIIHKHLMSKPSETDLAIETQDQKEFVINMYELFKDIDVNGDGQLEWQEFTSFTVEKANLLNKRARLASIAHYHDSSHTLDPASKYRHRHDISRFVNIPKAGHFAMVVSLS